MFISIFSMSYQWHLASCIGSGANGSAFLAYRVDGITQQLENPDEKYVIKQVISSNRDYIGKKN